MTQQQEIFTRLAHNSCMDVPTLEHLYTLSLDIATRNIPGDIVECGVYNGGSAGALVLPFATDLPQKRTLWLYDSFQGLPAPTLAKDSPDAECYEGRCRGDKTSALNTVRSTGYEGKIEVREGWFKDTFGYFEDPPRSIAILHIDADWYDGTLASLNRFYYLVRPGGIVILDDFGHWEGCRRAFYEFCCEWKVEPLLERYGHTRAWWVKGRENNREFGGK